ncbi:MAG: hypothetical protein ACD_39C01488G0001, partial [uncultured bacterium]
MAHIKRSLLMTTKPPDKIYILANAGARTLDFKGLETACERL